MRHILLGLAVLLAGMAVAQKPVLSGYLGKVNYAMLKYNTGVRLNHPEKWKRFSEVTTWDYSGVSAKSELELTIGRVFSNRFVVEGILGHNSMSMDLSYGSPSFYGPVTSSGRRRSLDFYLGYPKITDLYAGVGAKFYRRNKGALAPIGVYYGLKLNFHTYSVHLNDIIGGAYTSTGKDEQVELALGTYSLKFIEYSGTIGQTRAVMDNVLIDYGFSIGWGFVGSNFYDQRIPSEASFKDNFLQMIKTYQVGKVHIGVGYLF